MNRLLLLAPRIATNRLWARAGEVPSFHIAPARTQNARDLITGSVLGTYNSASPAWAAGPDGVLFQPAANAPVIDYDPVTLACLGARIWGVVTNQIRNNTGQGAATGTPGTLPANWAAATVSNGLNREIVGFGTLDGVNYVDIRYSGTTTAASNTVIQPETQTTITAAPGQTWTASAYVAIVGGSTSGINQAGRIRVTGRASGGTLNESAQIDFTPTSSLVRRPISINLTNATTARISLDVIFTYSSGAVIDITLRIGLPQLEQSATMGPVVKTTTTAASSTADVWSITGADFSRIWNQSAATMYVDAVMASATSASNQFIARASDNTYNNQISVGVTSGGYPQLATASGGTFDGVAGSSTLITANAAFKLAAASQLNDLALSHSSSIFTDSSANTPTSLTRLDIGSDHLGFNRVVGMYLREFAIFRSRRPNANLQAMTS